MNRMSMRPGSSCRAALSYGWCAVVFCLAVAPAAGQGLKYQDQPGPLLSATAQSGHRVQFDVTLYVWTPRMDGTVGLRGRTAEVDITFRKILEHLEGAFMLPVEARYGKWGFGVELIYIKVGDDRATPGSLFSTADFKAKQTIVEFGPRYRLIDSGPVAVDVLAGGRWWRLRNELRLEAALLPAVQLELNESWIDPFAGLRLFIDLTSRIMLQARGDLGGVGAESEFTWQALGGLGYRFSDRFTLKAGWRQLDVDFNKDDNGFIYDVGTGGVIVGGAIRF